MSADHVPSPQPADPADWLAARLGPGVIGRQPTRDGCPVLWLAPEAWEPAHRALRGLDAPFDLLADLYAIDEAGRAPAPGMPASGVTLCSHLLSLGRNADIRLKTACDAGASEAPSLAAVFPNADWYEREAFDMFGLRFAGRPDRRLLMAPDWQGHPLRKSYLARATERPPFVMTEDSFRAEEAAQRLDPEALGLPVTREGEDLMVLNFGPHHPSTHGVFRILLGLDGEEVIWAWPDIGYHHRGVEKMAERQTWHGFIPYTDRVDYLGGVTHELPYLLAVERLCGITVPDRAQCIRVMLCELYRIMNHLLFYGTMAQDVGQMSPVFYMFTDREKGHGFTEAVTGARMHPAFFRIGGVAMDLPTGWDTLLRDWLDWLPARLDDYDRMVLGSELVQIRCRGVGEIDAATARDWGLTGPILRAAGTDWDLRKRRPYSGYENYDFDVPLGARGDVLDRTRVRSDEMRQSLRILRQCLDHMPAGPIKADHPLTMPPPRGAMLHDIETLIRQFTATAYGSPVPAGEATGQVEGHRGLIQYSVISTGGTMSHRTRIRTPSFAALQTLPLTSPGMTVADLVAHIASLDFVMSDVDR